MPQTKREPGTKMSDADLLSLIAQCEKDALGSPVASGASVGTTYSTSTQLLTTLEIDRFDALNFYYGRPLGNEVENQSQVVLPELRDTVEWIKPQLMRIFAAAHTPCVFDPENEDDVDQAALETEAVRHVFMAENPGFFIIHDFCMDALLLRNGYIKVYLETKTQAKVEKYSGLTHTEVTQLLGDDEDIEILEQREYTANMPMQPQQAAAPGPAPAPMANGGGMAPSQPQMPPQGPQAPMGMQSAAPPGTSPMPNAAQVGGPPPGQPPPPPMPAPMGGAVPLLSVMPPVTVFDLKIRRTKEVKRVKVECAPPEEMLVSSKARGNLDESPFTCHKTEKSRSDLIEAGYEEDIVNKATAGSPRWLEMDALARDIVVDQMTIEAPGDFAMQMLEVRDVNIMVDYDGDGKAELRRVLVVGDEIAENEEIEEVAFASGVSKRMPHRHTGLSMYDELKDIQVIKSELLRQGLNGLRLANNSRVAVDWRNCNLTDLMTSRAGGVIRVNGNPQSVVMPFNTQSNMEQVVSTMGYMDSLREFRTGVGKDSVGLDADALQNVTKGGQLAGMAAAGLKIELIARCLSEGLKDVFLKIRALMVRHQDQPMQFQMRGKWVNVNPSEWGDRTRVSPNVGLGSGTREEARSNVMLLEQMQEKLASMGLVGPKQAYTTFKMACSLLGYEQPERFAMDPDSDEFKQWQAAHPPQQNPMVQVAQIRAQGQQASAQAGLKKTQIQTQADLATAQADAKADAAKAQAEITHTAMQNHQDRLTEMAGNDAMMWQTLVKAIAPIIASQLKGDPNANAGQVLQSDIRGFGAR